MQYEATSLGYDLKFNGPASVEEYDQKAGKPGSALEDAITNTIYRSTAPKWQDGFAKRVEEITGEKRAINEETTAKAQARADKAAAKKGVESSPVKPVLESVRVYVNRATGPFVDDKDVTAALEAAAAEVASTLEVDPSPSARAASINKGDLAKANEILTLDDEEIEAKVAKIESVVTAQGIIERDDTTGKPTAESLAKAIGVYLKSLL